MNSKDQYPEVSCERMVNKNKSTQKKWNDTLPVWIGETKRDSTIRCYPTNKSDTRKERYGHALISWLVVFGLVIELYTYITI